MTSQPRVEPAPPAARQLQSITAPPGPAGINARPGTSGPPAAWLRTRPPQPQQPVPSPKPPGHRPDGESDSDDGGGVVFEGYDPYFFFDPNMFVVSDGYDAPGSYLPNPAGPADGSAPAAADPRTPGVVCPIDEETLLSDFADYIPGPCTLACRGNTEITCTSATGDCRLRNHSLNCDGEVFPCP